MYFKGYRTHRSCPALLHCTLPAWCLFICLLLICTSAIGQGDKKSAYQKLRKEVEKIIRFETSIDPEKTPGFIVGMIDGDQQAILAFGSREQGSADTITPADIFELGSVSKPMTAALIMKLCEHPDYSLDDELSSWLGDQEISADLAATTISEMLTHLSGLPRLPTMFGQDQEEPDNPYASFSRSDLLDYIATASVDKSELPLYSTVSFAILELAVEYKTGMRFDEVFENFVSGPLKLDATGPDSAPLCPGYDLAGRLAENWRFPTFGASEGIKSNLNDLLRFVEYALGQPQSAMFGKSAEEFNRSLTTAPGWFVVKNRNAPDVFVHTGKTSGHNAYLALVPETRTGVVVLANSAYGTDDLGMQILRMMNNNWKRKS